ncbi:MAG TPA: hypothetical protein PKD53_32080 [Chloroflexaceae bacterium]|nr:hypothetical protein [Chloroflexaceae bacterium]
MATNTVAVQVPELLYRRLERLATLTNRPVESLLEQTLSAGLPPLPDDLPATMQAALLQLEKLSDQELQQVVRERMGAGDVEQFDELRERRRAGVITFEEAQRLGELTEYADLLMLRKAYAAVLLKWRGQPVPAPSDLPV